MQINWDKIMRGMPALTYPEEDDGYLYRRQEAWAEESGEEQDDD